MAVARARSAIAAASAIAAVSGCGRGDLTIIAPWSGDQVGAVVVTGPDGIPREAPQLRLDGSPLSIQIDRLQPTRLFASSFPRPGLSDPLVRCTLSTLNDTRTSSPAALASFATPVLEAGVETTFEAASLPFSWTLTECPPDAQLCTGVTVDSIPVRPIPKALDLLRVVARSSQEAVVGGSDRDAGGGGPSFVARVRLTGVVETLSLPGIEGEVRGLALQGDRLWIGTFYHWLVQADLDSGETRTGTIGQVNTIRAGRDGSAFGLVAMPTKLLRLTWGSTVAKRIPDAPAGIDQLDVYGSDRIIVAGQTAPVYVWDGDSWERGPEGAILPQVSAVAINERFAVALPRYSAAQRLEQGRGWFDIERPFNEFPLDVELRDDGLAVAVGNGGAMAIYHAGAWCHVVTGVETNLHSVSISPDGSVAFATGIADPSGAPPLIRVTLPPP